MTAILLHAWQVLAFLTFAACLSVLGVACAEEFATWRRRRMYERRAVAAYQRARRDRVQR